ncbi:AMP-binding protein, partial [Rhizorhapis sp. SPR117]|uniref:AMP-binding protein n=1 Tax=Rhizorhapis sp. SPR117 TaxID=2912611 RepID=UPI001F16AE5C|nr:AMP-binding protein [Rhizorhapis sp. SPR117]
MQSDVPDRYSPPPPWSWMTLPAPHHRVYRDDGFWRDKTIGDSARDWAMKEPDAQAFLGGTIPHTYQSLVADAEALAIGLLDLGLRPGEVISLQTPNWHEAGIINLAAALVGLVINPIGMIYRDAEVHQMLADSGSRLLFLTENFRGYDYAGMVGRIRGNLAGLRHVVFVRGNNAHPLSYEMLVTAGRGRTLNVRRVDADNVKLLLYTSGTTGRPKGVLHSHNTLTRVSEVSVCHWGIAAGDVLLMPSPVTHISGYSFGLELPFLVGTRTVLMESWNA